MDMGYQSKSVEPGLDRIYQSLDRIEVMLLDLVRSDRPKLSLKPKGSDDLPAERSELTDIGVSCPCGEENVEFLFHRWSKEEDHRYHVHACPECGRVFHVSHCGIDDRRVTVLTPQGDVEHQPSGPGREAVDSVD
jgi:hypothetical protein